MKIPIINFKITKSDIVFALVITLTRGLIVDHNSIPSASMYPTLEIGDHLVASKSHYNVRVPFTDDFVLSHRNAPEYGDIATFVFDEIGGKLAIKRVVAKEGDHVNVKGTDVFINGKRLSHKPVVIDSMKGEPLNTMIETSVDGKQYVVAYSSKRSAGGIGFADKDREFVVPKGYVFMMGDNRDNSFDTRYTQEGGVSIDKLHGKIISYIGNFRFFGDKTGSQHDVPFLIGSKEVDK